jgi:hypothetical protein
MSLTTGNTTPDTTPGRGAQVVRIPPPPYYGAAFAVGLLRS